MATTHAQTLTSHWRHPLLEWSRPLTQQITINRYYNNNDADDHGDGDDDDEN